MTLNFYIKKAFGPKKFTKSNLLPGFELEIEFSLMKGKFLGILGHSGSGKSSLLRCLAGLEKPDAGYIELDGTYWLNMKQGLNLRPQQRSVGLVFQDYALFPNMNALGNVCYSQSNKQRGMQYLDMVGLSDHATHFPRELSGGQKQRVALARALAREPQLLLLDEPLSAVDEERREELGELIRTIQKSSGISAIMVSHSKEEINHLCDEVLELHKGKIKPILKIQ